MYLCIMPIFILMYSVLKLEIGIKHFINYRTSNYTSYFMLCLSHKYTIITFNFDYFKNPIKLL